MNPSPSRPGLTIGTGVLVTIVVLVFARLAYGLILPAMRTGLGLSYQQAGNLATVTALGYLCLVMAAGIAAARWGGRRTVILGVVLTTLGFVGLSVASHYVLLVVLMALLGFGTAFAYTPLVSLLVGWYPERRGAVIGMLNSGVGIGMLLAGWLIPYLNEARGVDGWRLAWALFAAGGGLATVAALAFLRDPPGQGRGAGRSLPPVDKAAVYGNRRVIAVGILYGIVGLTYIAQAIFMYSFALEAGVSPLTAGRLAGLMGVLSIFSGAAWGWLSDRIGRGTVLVLSMALTLLGTAVPVVWPAPAGFAAHYLILGLTMSGLFTSVLAAATEHVGAREAPLAVSYVTFFFAVGQFAGPAVTGLLIDWGGGFRWAFAGSCAVMLAGLHVTWRIRGFRHPVEVPDAAPGAALPDARREGS